MSRHPTRAPLPSAQRVAEQVLSALDRFLHVEAVSGIALLVAAAAALIWANSPAAASYHQVWDTPIALGIGELAVSLTAHYVINEVLMTVFFLVVGMEIRREMHEGALADPRAAALPLAAAVGGVAVPATLYLVLIGDPAVRAGWAIPTATDIAFAVGVLAMLGRSIPAPVRILLLALAIVDDIAAVLIIAVFYSGGVDYTGLLVAGGGIVLVLALQRVGFDTALAYVVPGAIVWFGLLEAGIHPTLAGVALGLLTPPKRMRNVESTIDDATRALAELRAGTSAGHAELSRTERAFRRLCTSQRHLLPPLTRVQMKLHPWVAYCVMPLFALANAGVSLDGLDLQTGASQGVVVAVTVALVLGKPIGIIGCSWLVVRLGWCALPPLTGWGGVTLVGILGGIGFTMSIFIANLAFIDDPGLLSAAKCGVLLASALAGVTGLLFGWSYGSQVSVHRAAAVVVTRPPTAPS